MHLLTHGGTELLVEYCKTILCDVSECCNSVDNTVNAVRIVYSIDTVCHIQAQLLTLIQSHASMQVIATGHLIHSLAPQMLHIVFSFYKKNNHFSLNLWSIVKIY